MYAEYVTRSRARGASQSTPSFSRLPLRHAPSSPASRSKKELTFVESLSTDGTDGWLPSPHEMKGRWSAVTCLGRCSVAVVSVASAATGVDGAFAAGSDISIPLKGQLTSRRDGYEVSALEANSLAGVLRPGRSVLQNQKDSREARPRP